MHHTEPQYRAIRQRLATLQDMQTHMAEISPFSCQVLLSISRQLAVWMSVACMFQSFESCVLTNASLNSQLDEALARLQEHGLAGWGGSREDASNALRQTGHRVVLQCLQHHMLVCRYRARSGNCHRFNTFLWTATTATHQQPGLRSQRDMLHAEQRSVHQTNPSRSLLQHMIWHCAVYSVQHCAFTHLLRCSPPTSNCFSGRLWRRKCWQWLP